MNQRIKTPEYTYVIYNGYMPDEKQKEYLYDDKKDPFQLNPEVIDRDSSDPRILKFRSLLKEYLAKLNDPFLWDWER